MTDSLERVHSHLPAGLLLPLVLCLLTGVSCSAEEAAKRAEEPSGAPASGAGEPASGPGAEDPGAEDPGAKQFEGEPISEVVRRVFQASSGELWFGTQGGACRYDGTSLSDLDFEAELGVRVTVHDIAEDAAGTLWFATTSGLIKFDGESLSRYTTEDGLNSDDVWCLCVDRKGVLWAGTLEGACRLDEASGKFVPFVLPAAPGLDPLRGVSSLHIVHCIMQDRAGNMWFTVGTGGVHKFDGAELTNISEEDGLCNNSVNCILEDRRGDLWFATAHGGVCRYDGTSFARISEAEGVKGTEVWDLFEDSKGNIWFPAEGFGVYRYDGESFSNFSTEQGLSTNAPQSVSEDAEGRIWCCGFTGAYRLDGDAFGHVSRDGPWR